MTVEDFASTLDRRIPVLVDVEIYRAREARCRDCADRAKDPDVKWMYEDMAKHYARLIKWGAYDANARSAKPVSRDD